VGGKVAGVVLGLLIGGGVMATVFRVQWKYMGFLTPGMVLKRLDQSPEHVFETRLRGASWAWDPTPGSFKSVRAGRVYGPGQATYRRDGGEIVLEVHGDRRHSRYRGPVPAEYQPGTPEARALARRKLLIPGALGLYVIAAGVGFAVGYSTSSSARWGNGALGAFAGFFVFALLLHFVMIGVGASGRMQRLERPLNAHADEHSESDPERPPTDAISS
jgi:hypothetical protein